MTSNKPAYSVRITEDAICDIDDLVTFLAERESPQRAAHVLEKIEQRIMHLSNHPQRGSVVKELAELGINEYRELFVQPYRIIYRILDKTVYILLVSDGRRDMQTLLQRRLMAG